MTKEHLQLLKAIAALEPQAYGTTVRQRLAWSIGAVYGRADWLEHKDLIYPVYQRTEAVARFPLVKASFRLRCYWFLTDAGKQELAKGE